MSEQKGKILIVEDEELYAQVYKSRLAPLGYEIDIAMDIQSAFAKVKTFQPEIMVLDLRLQRQDSEEGLSFLQEVMQQHNSEIKVIVVTVEGTTETARKALQLGAYDFIEKKTQGYNELQFRVNQAYERLQLERRISDQKRAELENFEGYRYGEDGIIVGNSEAMHQLYSLLDQVAPTDATVLIRGESGTGKELIAKAIHAKSRRNHRTMVPVNCGAIPSELLESELFGHARGAFTTAVNVKKGLFEEADGSTLFLDEIAEFPFPLQVKLLRALQEGEIRRVGENLPTAVDVRLIAATNQDLEKALEAGTFREDLYYRLTVVPLDVPPLRERKSDIPLLANYFLKKKGRDIGGKRILGFRESAMMILMSYSWPGNVRELEHSIERAVISAQGDFISADDITVQSFPVSNGNKNSLPGLVDEYERLLILDALSNAKDQKAAAEMLDIPESTLRNKMDKHNIERKRSKGLS